MRVQAFRSRLSRVLHTANAVRVQGDIQGEQPKKGSCRPPTAWRPSSSNWKEASIMRPTIPRRQNGIPAAAEPETGKAVAQGLGRELQVRFGGGVVAGHQHLHQGITAVGTVDPKHPPLPMGRPGRRILNGTACAQRQKGPVHGPDRLFRTAVEGRLQALCRRPGPGRRWGGAFIFRHRLFGRGQWRRLVAGRFFTRQRRRQFGTRLDSGQWRRRFAGQGRRPVRPGDGVERRKQKGNQWLLHLMRSMMVPSSSRRWS